MFMFYYDLTFPPSITPLTIEKCVIEFKCRSTGFLVLSVPVN